MRIVTPNILLMWARTGPLACDESLNQNSQDDIKPVEIRLMISQNLVILVPSRRVITADEARHLHKTKGPRVTPLPLNFFNTRAPQQPSLNSNLTHPQSSPPHIKHQNAPPRPNRLNRNRQIHRLGHSLLSTLLPPHNRRRHHRAESSRARHSRIQCHSIILLAYNPRPPLSLPLRPYLQPQ